MIQLFEIKKKVKQMKNTDKELLEKYTETSKKNKEEILKEYNTKEEGLTQKEYQKTPLSEYSTEELLAEIKIRVGD